jgi:ABC-type branched-subunit amino acid transport system substrate-binding protein
MKKIFSLLLLTIFIFGCQSTSNQQKPSYQKDQDLPKPVEVAILLPLSGENKQMGGKLDELMKLGLGDGSAKNLSVTSYDISGGQNIESIMKQVIARKTSIILGPILSQDTMQVAMQAKPNGIVMLSLSNNPAIADQDVYIFGHGPLQQTKRLMHYLAKSGASNLILLLPDTRQSDSLANVLTDIAVQNNITLTKIEKYLMTPESIDSKMQAVSELIDSLNENPENTAKPTIYLADEPENLVLIFNGLTKYNIDKKANICGENKIDIKYSDPIEIMFTGSLNVLNSKLTKDLLQDAFGSEHLSFWDKMAYDLGLITSYAIGTENFNKEGFINRLSNPSGYIGISGSVKFNDHIAERKYDIIKRKGTRYETIDRDRGRF